MASLFDLNASVARLYDMLENGVDIDLSDLDPSHPDYDSMVKARRDEADTLQNEMLDGLRDAELSVDEKLTNYAKFVLSLEATAEAQREMTRRMLDRARRVENHIARLKEDAKTVLVRRGVTRFSTPVANISIRQSKAVEVVDESALPDTFVRIKREPDKRAISDALRAGLAVAGAEFVVNESLQVRS